MTMGYYIATLTVPKSMPETTLDQRLAFAKKYVKEPEIWTKIIFSDEADLYPTNLGSSIFVGIEVNILFHIITFKLNGIQEP